MEIEGPIQHSLTLNHEEPKLIVCGVHKYLRPGDHDVTPVQAEYQWHVLIDYGDNEHRTFTGHGNFMKQASRNYSSYDECVVSMNDFLMEELYSVRQQD